MKNEEILILMYKDFEVLKFHVDYLNRRAKLIEKLDGFEYAPLIILNSDNIESSLILFFTHRSIPNSRTNYQEILKATGCRSGFELSFQGHGLSLSDHYWYKRVGENLRYQDINFFLNKWDDSFAKAILNHDFEALKHSSLNVPDIVTSGWGEKGWIYEDGSPKLFKLGIYKDHSEEAIAEVLASKIAKRLFPNNQVLDYELRKVGDRYASISPVMIDIDEELIPLADYVDRQTYKVYLAKTSDKYLTKEFFDRIQGLTIPGLTEFFVKLTCLKDLCFISDFHFNNISLIKNRKTGEIRLAPLYDLGGAFGSSENGQKMLSNPNKATLLIIYFLFNDLEPDWDYSWYNPDSLIGVEEDIREYLSKSEFYTPELIDCVIEVYHKQKAALDDMWHSCDKRVV